MLAENTETLARPRENRRIPVSALRIEWLGQIGISSEVVAFYPVLGHSFRSQQYHWNFDKSLIISYPSKKF